MRLVPGHNIFDVVITLGNIRRVGHQHIDSASQFGWQCSKPIACCDTNICTIAADACQIGAGHVERIG